MSKPIALVLGAGKNIGASVAQKLLSQRYRVAHVARSAKSSDSDEDNLQLTADLTKPDQVSDIFAKLRQTWGEPSVVFYNAAGAHFTDASDPLGASVKDFETDLAINTTTLFAVAKEAISGFKQLPSSAAKTLFYTGNLLNDVQIPGLLTLGVGKAAGAYIIQALAGTPALKEEGMRFYYVDQRKPDGGPMGRLPDAPAHAEFIYQLINDKASEVPWQVTFVKDKGYTKFPVSKI